jgi:hypothetical protein
MLNYSVAELRINTILSLFFIYIQSLSLEALSQSFLKSNYTHPELAALRNAVGESQATELGRI